MMAQIGFNIPLITELGDGWRTERSPPPRPPPRQEPIMRTYQKHLAASIRRQIRQKEVTSVVLQHRFVASESLEHSRKWFQREVEAQLQRGGLFEDPFMPPVDSTIWPDRSNSSSKYRWCRPREIVADPQFVADGLSRFDIRQGELGDCWLIAALACLSMHQKLLNEVVPCGQSFVPSKDGSPLNAEGGFAYVGMFWFRFWYFGHWIDVVVDDRLPTDGSRLCFMHSSDRREFWSALLEKAYAKLIGSYDALRGGTTSEGMEDFTGGMCEMIDLGDKAPENLFSIMSRAHSRCSLLACSIDAHPEELEADGPYGLIKGHAYSITDVRTIRETSGDQKQMVRLRNPWGNEREWVGPWSDKSKEWSRISPEERMKIGLTFDNDGEFWMAFKDFKYYFSRLEMCHLSPDFDHMENTAKDAPPKRKWEMTRHEGEWLRNSTAGGCLNNRNTFYMNPQIRVSVVDADEADDDPTGTIVVGLMQKGMREKRQSPFSIGYFPAGAPANALLTREFFLRTPMSARSIFANTREVCGRHKLMPGDYVIVPSTFMPNEEAKFLLRIFSERPYTAGELDDQIACGVDPAAPLPAIPKDAEMIAKLKSAFDAIAGDAGDIEAEDLRNILNRAFANKVGERFEGFSLETARSMVALMDVDTSGTLGFEEFKTLWYELRLWLTIFKEADAAKEGKLCTYDLRTVLSDIGITISNEIFKAIVCRYAHDGVIVFDDFVLLLVRLITVFGKFKENLADRQSLKASFYVDEFLRCVLYT
ncbi:Calpain-B [Taenia solium]|eukprot:TsM_000669900 transcript=TsM_000669900 gene=TsM_000669900